MNTHLMYRHRDFYVEEQLPWRRSERKPPWHEESLLQDLELNTLLEAMAGADEFLFDVARKALLSSMRNDVETILYRQAILRDCLRNPKAVRDLYAVAVETIQKSRSWWSGISSHHPSGILSQSVHLLDTLVDALRKLRDTARAQAHLFESEGLSTLCEMLERELSDDYLADIRSHLKELRFPRGVLLSAQLGDGNQSATYVLRRRQGKEPSWLRRILGRGQPAYTFSLSPYDQAGGRILSEMRDKGTNLVANALGQSSDHVGRFFATLRTELAFYVGCLNLHERLISNGRPVCFPRPVAAGQRKHRFSGLYDACLSLVMGERRVVANTADADGKDLIVITGANQGGKSVFLRSIGLAQMMMQCGMFVTAESFEAELCEGLFTHYKREEDAAMKSGRLDEELARMSDIVNLLTPNSMLLCNESFAATNYREGSEIARQIVRALLESRVKVFFVTHLYEFAQSISSREAEDTLYLRAERMPDGTRTFRLIEGRPLETSFGEDVYREVFSVSTGDSK
jgi:DNA mismatch repair ATPase MutS